MVQKNEVSQEASSGLGIFPLLALFFGAALLSALTGHLFDALGMPAQKSIVMAALMFVGIMSVSAGIILLIKENLQS
jgi:hypothetical protein